MKKTLTTKSSNNRIVKFLMVLALGVLTMSGCSQVNDLVNGNKAANTNTATNSNASANTNTNANVNTPQTFKNDLLGTWIGVDDPKKKIVFTADEMTAYEDGKENKLKYTRLSNDEIELIFDGKKVQVKTTFEGEVLTMTGDVTVKFKRESANATNNSAANTNTSASNTAPEIATVTKDGDPLTAEEKDFAINLIGTWDAQTNLIIFTKDKVEFTFKVGDEPYNVSSYKIVDEKVIEFTYKGGSSATATMTFENNGNTLIWVEQDRNYICKRVNPK